MRDGKEMCEWKHSINGADETEYRGEIDQRLVCFKHAK